MTKNKFIKSSVIAAFMLTFLVGCDPYEEYIRDYDYSAVYFGSQQPLRTLVTREAKGTLDFKLGVVLAGLLENKTGEWVTFEIDPDLLQTVAGASAFTLLPNDWYQFSITENKITIPAGKFLGDFTISIDKSKFTADPLSLTNTYALPIRIVATSADSILRGDEIVKGKDYTILVVKYISEYSGTYYVRGEQLELDNGGNAVDGSTISYYKTDWSQNSTRTFTTITPSECEVTGIGSEVSQKMKVSFSENHAVTLITSDLPITDLGSVYDAEQGIYHFKYSYVKSGKTYRVDEYLKQRNDPENDLRFEEW